MNHKKIIVTTILSLLLSDQAYSFSVAKVAQSATTNHSQECIVGYRVAQAAFFLASMFPLIESWKIFCSRKQFPPVSGNRLAFLQNICRDNDLDPNTMHLGLHRCSQKDHNILSAAIGPDTILIDTAEMDDKFDQMLANQKNNWLNIPEATREEQRQQEQRKIDAAKTVITHEIGHLQKGHYYKEPIVQTLGYAAIALLFERYVHHKGFLQEWFESPTTLTSLCKCSLSYALTGGLCHLLSKYLIFLPYSRSCEREADAYAIRQAQQSNDLRAPDNLEAVADRLEKLFQQRINAQRERAGRQPIVLGSFRERYLTNFKHPSFSERITYFRAAAQCLREKQRMSAQTKQS